MNTVTFCGHSDISAENKQEIYNDLCYEIENLIKQGATKFLLGGYGDFDILSAKAVKELKKTYPYIKSILVIPYLNKTYSMELYDESEYPPIEHSIKRFAIVKRNEYMVECADVVIAYVNQNWGGAKRTLKYAVRKNKDIINISKSI